MKTICQYGFGVSGPWVNCLSIAVSKVKTELSSDTETNTFINVFQLQIEVLAVLV